MYVLTRLHHVHTGRFSTKSIETDRQNFFSIINENPHSYKRNLSFFLCIFQKIDSNLNALMSSSCVAAYRRVSVIVSLFLSLVWSRRTEWKEENKYFSAVLLLLLQFFFFFLIITHIWFTCTRCVVISLHIRYSRSL